MNNFLMTMSDKPLLRKDLIIETLNDELKNILLNGKTCFCYLC